MKQLIIALGILAGSSAAASAQTGLERAKAALPPTAGQALEQTVAAARSRGLPTDPLVNKALEGVAKHAPADLILEVVRQRLELLARADAVLRPMTLATAGTVAAVADVMQRGVDEDVVKRVASDSRSGEPIDLALHTLADLLERGVPVEIAYDMLSSWRAHGGNPEELRDMPATVARLIGEGASPSNAGQAVAASVRSGKPVRAAVGQRAKSDVTKPGKGRVGAPVPPGKGPPAERGRKNKDK